MSFVDIFYTLTPPDAGNRNLFNAAAVKEYPFAKVAISNESFPAVLISLPTDRNSFFLKNVRLKYLELVYNVDCKISESDMVSFAVYTVIVFKSNQATLQQYFLKIAELLIESLSGKPTQNGVTEAFKAFVEIFRSLSDVPTKTVQGLWSELFIIDTSRLPATLLNYWHCRPEEKFDFNADIEKLEVKSSSILERIHTFASEQLNPPSGKQVVIASVFLRQAANGRSIADLAGSIQHRIADHNLLQKMFTVILATLGNTFEQSVKIKFDYDLAKSSLRFYRHQDIHKIEKAYTPTKVSEVRYKSDLTELDSIYPSSMDISGQLYAAL